MAAIAFLYEKERYGESRKELWDRFTLHCAAQYLSSIEEVQSLKQVSCIFTHRAEYQEKLANIVETIGDLPIIVFTGGMSGRAIRVDGKRKHTFWMSIEMLIDDIDEWLVQLFVKINGDVKAENISEYIFEELGRNSFPHELVCAYLLAIAKDTFNVLSDAEWKTAFAKYKELGGDDDEEWTETVYQKGMIQTRIEKLFIKISPGRTIFTPWKIRCEAIDQFLALEHNWLKNEIMSRSASQLGKFLSTKDGNSKKFFDGCTANLKLLSSLIANLEDDFSPKQLVDKIEPFKRLSDREKKKIGDAAHKEFLKGTGFAAWKRSLNDAVNKFKKEFEEITSGTTSNASAAADGRKTATTWEQVLANAQELKDVLKEVPRGVIFGETPLNAIHVLVIDDQLGTDQSLADNFLDSIEAKRVGDSPIAPNTIVVHFCSGQNEQGENDYSVIEKAVKERYGDQTGFNWSLILLDLWFDSASKDVSDQSYGLTALKKMQVQFPELPLVMYTSGHESKCGSSPYLSKEGIDDLKFRKVLLDQKSISIEQRRHLLALDDECVFTSTSMFDVYCDAAEQARNNINILINGESGTGKEQLASYLHKMSNRREKPFLAVNAGAVAGELAESEFFGHAAGAFNNAKARKGYFETTHGGTLFLDEIGEMPSSMQATLLRTIQEKKVRPVGANTEIDVDVRIICATNKNLLKMVKQGEFREDLYYRIAGAILHIPKLRDHADDIRPLAQYFLSKEMKKKNNPKTGILFSEGALCKLEKFNFPGNVRQLKNMIDSIVGGKGSNALIKSTDIDKHLNPTFDGYSNIAESKPVISVSLNDEAVTAQLTIPISTSPTEIKTIQATPSHIGSNITLESLLNIIAGVTVDEHDPALCGITPLLDAAIQALMKRCYGAALKKTANSVSSELSALRAFKHLTNNETKKATAANRAFNAALGKPQTVEGAKTLAPTSDELDHLVAAWRAERDKSN